MIEIDNLNCCGIKEITNLADHDNALDALRGLLNRYLGDRARDYYWDNAHMPAFLLFTQARGDGGLWDEYDDRRYGEDFAALINDLELGTCFSAGERVNHNSGNQLTPWIWRVDEDACRRWWRKDQAAQRRAKRKKKLTRH